jgi:hypothetical protein
LLFVSSVAVQVRTRSSRKTPNDLSPNGLNENSSNAMMMNDRKSTGASRKSARSQITIATSTTDTSNTSSKLNRSSKTIEIYFLIGTTGGNKSKRQPFQRLLTLVG